MNFFNNLTPSKKAIVISIIAVLITFIWFFFLSNLTNSKAEDDLILSQTQDLMLIDCSGENRNSPLCVEREEALDAIKDLNETKDNLLDLNVEIWSKEEYSLILTKEQEGKALFDQGFYGKAKFSYQAATKDTKELIKKGRNLFSNYSKEGFNLLDQEKDEEAKILFEKALIIIPSDKNTLIGLQRASVLKEVIKFQKEYEIFIKVGDYDNAFQSLTNAIKLDSTNQKTKNLKVKLDKLIQERNLSLAIDEGYFYLENNDYKNARDSFERAVKIDNFSQPALTGIDLVTEAEKREKINSDRLMAERYFRDEQFLKSVNYYSSILQIDSSMSFAATGLSRSKEYINLEERMDKYLNRPDRVSSKAVFLEASNLSVRLKNFEFGKRLTKKRKDLSSLLAQYSSLVTLRLSSDNKTQILIQNGQDLGIFLNKDINLYPGKYTFIGKRKNYVTVRRVIEISETTSLYISCQEKI